MNERKMNLMFDGLAKLLQDQAKAFQIEAEQIQQKLIVLNFPGDSTELEKK